MTKGKQDLILISTEIGFKAKKWSVKQDHFTLINVIIQNEDIMVMGIYTLNSRVVIFGTVLSIC